MAHCTTQGEIIENSENKRPFQPNLRAVRIVYESATSRIVQVETGEYEVGHILKTRNGIVEPTGDDFGVWVWTAYTLAKAYEIFYDIEAGRKPIRSMEAQL